jgi:hypothetical protein
MGGQLNAILAKYNNLDLPIDIENIAKDLGTKIIKTNL